MYTPTLFRNVPFRFGNLNIKSTNIDPLIFQMTYQNYFTVYLSGHRLAVHLYILQTVKTLEKKPNVVHHCSILQKHDLLSWRNMVKFSNLCLMSKILHGLLSPPLHQFVNKQQSEETASIPLEIVFLVNL